MKTKAELEVIADDLAGKLKGFVRSQGMVESLRHGGRVVGDGERLYATLRESCDAELSEEERHKLDHMVARRVIVASRKHSKVRLANLTSEEHELIESVHPVISVVKGTVRRWWSR
jgi:hypothetical protein